MMHDLYQINPTLGAYTSAINPATAINPLAAALSLSAMSPIAGMTQFGQQGYPGIALHGQMNPQHLQLAAQAAQAAQLLGIQNPLQAALYHQQLLAQASLQNPYAATVFQNPLLGGGFQNPFIQQQNPFVQQQNPFVQQQNPYLQQQNPYVQQQNPYLQQQNPYLQQQNPYLQQQNPFVQQQNPFVNPILAQQHGSLLGPQIGGQPYMQYPQMGSPYGQVNPVLAPQSWVGQGGQFGGGQIHPLVQQLIARQFQTPGFVPWAGI